jgi:hypothetical protein
MGVCRYLIQFHVPDLGVKQAPDLEPCLARVLEAKGMMMPIYLTPSRYSSSLVLRSRRSPLTTTAMMVVQKRRAAAPLCVKFTFRPTTLRTVVNGVVDPDPHGSA